jgi:hypothetical protein
MSHLPTRHLILATFALAVCLLAPTAQAEVPSVDAYGGEALVLGTPHHRGAGGTTQRSGGGSGSQGSSETGASSGNGHSPGSSGGGGSSSTGSGGSGSTGGGASTHTGGGGANNNGTQPSNGSGSGSGGSSKGGSGNATPVSSTASAFSGGDILLILLGLLCIAGVGVVLRVARKPAGEEL